MQFIGELHVQATCTLLPQKLTFHKLIPYVIFRLGEFVLYKLQNFMY